MVSLYRDPRGEKIFKGPVECQSQNHNIKSISTAHSEVGTGDITNTDIASCNF